MSYTLKDKTLLTDCDKLGVCVCKQIFSIHIYLDPIPRATYTGDDNVPLLATDRTTRQKIGKDIEYLNSTPSARSNSHLNNTRLNSSKVYILYKCL